MSSSTISFYDVSIVPFLNGLRNAQAFIQKGITHLETTSQSPDTILTASLHPDMKPFIYQIQRFTDSAKAAAARINPAIEALALPDEEKTFPEVMARIEKCIKYLENVDKKLIDGREAETVKMPYGQGVVLEFKALDYIVKFAHPNFWFHVTTTYAILRMKGVDVGKLDFLNGSGQMMPKQSSA